MTNNFAIFAAINNIGKYFCIFFSAFKKIYFIQRSCWKI